MRALVLVSIFLGVVSSLQDGLDLMDELMEEMEGLSKSRNLRELSEADDLLKEADLLKETDFLLSQLETELDSDLGRLLDEEEDGDDDYSYSYSFTSEPTYAPTTSAPTTRRPSTTPTLSPAPTISLPPTKEPTSKPTGTPTISLAPTVTADTCAMLVVVMDESGSMQGEQEWIENIFADLFLELENEGVNALNMACVVGFEDVDALRDLGCSFFDSTKTYSDVFAPFQLVGGNEDGYAAIEFSIDLADEFISENSNLVDNRCTSVVKMIILVTDEDRDQGSDSSVSEATTRAKLLSGGWVLNAILRVDSVFEDLVGVYADGSVIQALTGGNYITNAAGTVDVESLSWERNSLDDYARLAWDFNGVSWNLQTLRSGGDQADAFSNAFIAIKASEVVNAPTQLPTPVPSFLVGDTRVRVQFFVVFDKNTGLAAIKFVARFFPGLARIYANTTSSTFSSVDPTIKSVNEFDDLADGVILEINIGGQKFNFGSDYLTTRRRLSDEDEEDFLRSQEALVYDTMRRRLEDASTLNETLDNYTVSVDTVFDTSAFNTTILDDMVTAVSNDVTSGAFATSIAKSAAKSSTLSAITAASAITSISSVIFEVTQAPTISLPPTGSAAPTRSPSASPTAAPTISPAPTASAPPTADPTESPTFAPTITPVPTAAPSLQTCTAPTDCDYGEVCQTRRRRTLLFGSYSGICVSA